MILSAQRDTKVWRLQADGLRFLYFVFLWAKDCRFLVVYDMRRLSDETLLNLEI